MAKSWEQILGGYATDTLTEEEKRQLYVAALRDQALFDALADEESLKALLSDPVARQRVLASLQGSGNSQESTQPFTRKLSWFSQPSSLAWAGSIAAAGLALIFGWQMNKDWGSLVQQEQEAQRSMSEDQDNNEVAFRSQAPEVSEQKAQVQDLQKQDQREPEQIAALPAPVDSPQASTIGKASKPPQRLRQPSQQVRSEDTLRQEVKKERRLKASESVPQPPESAIVQNVPDKELMVVPSVPSPEVKEKSFQQLPQPPAFADKLEEENVLSSVSVKELFHANKGKRNDAVEGEIVGMRAQQLLGGPSPQTEKGFTGNASDLKQSQEVAEDFSQGQMRGIRYSFVRRATDGKDEAIDIKKFSGNWTDLHLVIESNVSGHLYVLTSFGKEKWQSVRPGSANITVLPDGAIKVQGYQSVDFALSQITNIVGKPVVSSLTVLLSSSPLVDLGRRLGNNVDMSKLQIEGADGTIFVVAKTPESVEPLRADIPLEE
jgi:hypothetical protein